MTAPYPSPVQTWHNDAYPAIDPARPELSLHGKRVIVTGGGGTIGLAMVEAFAKAGVALVGIVGRTQKTLDATKSKVEAQFPKVQIVSATANIADAASVDAAFKQIRSHADGPIDILVANAGYLSDLATLWTSEPNEWWKSFEINIKGAFNTIRAFHNVADTRATVINISTAAAQVPSAVPQLSAYSASKRAAVTVFEYLQMENPDWQVVSIQPGIIASDMSRKNAGMPPEDTPELPAAFTIWLCSPEAKFLKNKFVWANWDVEELKAKADLIQNSPVFTFGLIGWPVLPEA